MADGGARGEEVHMLPGWSRSYRSWRQCPAASSSLMASPHPTRNRHTKTDRTQQHNTDTGPDRGPGAITYRNIML